MGSSISQTTDYSAAMNTIRAEVEAYCEANGIDAAEYLDNLDQNLTAGVFDNATFDAYFQLAYMQLMEILNPEVINSLEGQIGGDVNFETLYANADDEVNDLIKTMIEDDPELMAYFARQAAGQTEEDVVRTLLQAVYDSVEGAEGYVFTQDARDFGEEFNLGSFYDSIIDQEDAFKSAEMSILDRLADYDAAMISIQDAFNSGNLSEVAYEAELQEIYFGRESLMGIYQSISDAEMTYFETMSKIYQQAFQTEEAIINRWV